MNGKRDVNGDLIVESPELVSRFRRVWRSFRAWGAPLFTAVATVTGVVLGVKSQDPQFAEYLPGTWWAFAISSGFALICTLILQRPSYSALVAEVERLKQGRADALEESEKSKALHSTSIEEVTESLLRGILSDCKINTNSTRATTYLYQDSQFYSVARFSRHQERGKFQSHLEPHPVGKGVIGQAWDHGERWIVSNLPEDHETWCTMMQEPDYGYSFEEAQSIRMKSRSYIAIVLRVEHHNVGVLVLESMEPEGVNEKIYKGIAGKGVLAALAELMHQRGELLPRAENIGAPVPSLPALAVVGFVRHWIENTRTGEVVLPAPGSPHPPSSI